MTTFYKTPYAMTFIQFRWHFLLGIEWLYFSVGPVEPEIWNRKESILKNAKSILKIAHTMADVGAKSANRGSTRAESTVDA